MTALLAMPDDPTAIPGWLDGMLLGAELPDLVAELRHVHRPGPPPPLAAVLGRSREVFLAGGFAAVPSATRKDLLRNPDVLSELAELVFTEGGEHWLGGPLAPLEQARAEKVAANVSAALRSAEPRRGSGWAERVGWVAAMAAAVLVAVTAFGTGSASAGWGFAKIAELPRTGGAKAVYAKLADLADEWNKKPTADRLALAKRLTEFRLGCSALQAADLPLPAVESRWVKDRCTEWAALLDGHLRDLDATGDVPAVRVAATATAAGIARELRGRNAA